MADTKQKGPAAKAPPAKPQQAKGSRVAKPRMGNIIRVAETNLDGSKPVRLAIQRIRGVGNMFGNAVSIVSRFGDRKLESLSQEELKKLVEIIQNPEKFAIHSWMFNRRKDPIKGMDRHLGASTLEFAMKMDINEMKKLKTYKGIRHSYGLPVRGQRTRGSFRKGKAVGVKRQKQKPTKAKK